VAEQTFRRIDGYELIEKVAQGVSFADGREASHRAATQSAAPRGPSKEHPVAAGL